jgi:hypothetical protein
MNFEKNIIINCATTCTLLLVDFLSIIINNIVIYIIYYFIIIIIPAFINIFFDIHSSSFSF